MKRLLVFLATASFVWTMLPAQANQSTDEGYVFVSNLQSHSRKSLKSRVKSTIEAGHVAIKKGNDLSFPCVDAVEYITLGSGSFYKYYPPAQDIVPPEYVSVAAFKKAVRKVNISSLMPAGWETGKRYVFTPPAPNENIKSVTIRTVRLSNQDATLVTSVDDDFKPLTTINITGETLVEIKFFDDTVYIYKGQEVVPAINCTSNFSEYSYLEVDDNGIVYSKKENGVRQPDAKLSYVFGEYPAVNYFGWISASEIVIDDLLFVLTTSSVR